MQPNSLSSEPPLILCVDDDIVVLAHTEAALRSRGYTVLTAADGQTALELFACAKVNAVVLDYEMPGQNGVQIARKLKHMNPRVPKILFTSNHSVPRQALQLVDTMCKKCDGVRALVSCVELLLRGGSSASTMSLNAHIAVANFRPEWEVAANAPVADLCTAAG